MTYRPSGGFTLDTNNSTTDILAASATFTGTATDVLAYNQIHFTTYQEPNVVPNGDGNTAKASLYFEFSPDGTNWDISVPVFIRSGINIPQTLVVVDRYFRVRYVNDGGAAAITALGLSDTADTARDQTALRLNSYLGVSGTKELGRTIDQSISGSDPVNLVRSVSMGQAPDGTFINTPVNSAGALFSAQFLAEVAAGNVPGHACVRVFSKNPAIGTTEEDMWVVGGVYPWLEAAESFRIKAGGNANDTAAGSGARAVEIDFLDEAGTLTTETLATNGASASSETAANGIRLLQARVSSVGSYTGKAAAVIDIETTSTTTLIGRININLAESRLSMYSVPLGKTAYILRVRTMVEGSKNCSVYAYYRNDLLDVTAPMSPRIRFLIFDNQSGGTSDGFTLQCPIKFEALTDIWWAGNTSSGSSSASIAYDILLVDD